MIATVQTLFKGETIKAVIGGFHLKLQPERDNMAGTRKDIEFIANELINQKVQKIYTGHCTGGKAYSILRNELKERIAPLYTGNIIDL